jgi:hypothetical protein
MQARTGGKLGMGLSAVSGEAYRDHVNNGDRAFDQWVGNANNNRGEMGDKRESILNTFF